jgi:hypothetical protein
LSSSEAKYVAMSEAVKEIRFAHYLLMSLGISVKLPIFIAENPSSGVSTRHIDKQYLSIREHMEDG